MSKFKVGDKIRVVKAQKYIPEIEGEVGTVFMVRDNGNYPITVKIGYDRYHLSYNEIEHVHDDSDNGYNRGDRVLVKNFGDYMQCEILSDGFYYAGAKRYVVRSISEDVMRIINENQITETLEKHNS